MSLSLSALSPSSPPVDAAELLGEFWNKTGVGLCMTDARGVIVLANKAFADTVGFQPGELSGCSITRLLAPEAAVRGAVNHEAFISGEDKAVEETTYVHKSGRPLFAHATDARVRSRDGRLFRVTTLIDLGRQAQGERHLRQMQRADHFAALASDISNDFNNLLSIILGYTAFLQDGSPDRARLGLAVDGIESAVRRAANLIKQTLYLSRKSEPAFQRANIGVFVQEYGRMMGDMMGQELQFGYDLPPELPASSLDPFQINHVLTNLCQKAREIAGEGGRIYFSTALMAGADLRAKFVDAQEPAYVALTVRIEPAAAAWVAGERPNTWEAAVRFVEKRRDLSILVVHSIVTGHRGHMETDAWSAPALIFRLYFPALSEAAAQAPAEPAGLAITPAQTRTILLVDDEETLLHALGFTLERNGFDVIKARDGIEAVDLFRENNERVALVLLDLGLPRMSGWEAFMKIKEHATDVNVIIMSGHLEANLQTEIMKAGARGYLQKPFAVAEALGLVKRFFAEIG